MNEKELKELKNEIYSFIKNVKKNHKKTQYWLNPTPRRVFGLNPNMEANTRVDAKGKERNLMVSDMGSINLCERSFAASYSSRTVSAGDLQKTIGLQTHNRGGALMHSELERLAPTTWWTEKTENEKAREASLEGKKHFPRILVKIDPVGDRNLKSVNGKSSGIWGRLDAYNEPKKAVIEFKGVPEGDPLPDEVPPKAFTQASLYAYSMGPKKVKYAVWIYLPTDLNKLDPEDVTTYRVHIKTFPELFVEAKTVIRKAKRVTKLVDAIGFDDAVDYLKCFNFECTICPQLKLERLVTA